MQIHAIKQNRSLEIKSFSCIDHAKLNISDLTVIIGPQASGKSIICKLHFFFETALRQIPRWIVESSENEGYKERILEEFKEWFQPATWGTKSFSINFTSNEFSLTIFRGRSKSQSGRAKIAISENLEAAAENAIHTIKIIREKDKNPNSAEYERSWQLLSAARDIIYPENLNKPQDEHLYIPAGRSFFTSIGKIVTAFEDRSTLDPVVTRFGRLVSFLREDPSFNPMPPSSPFKNIASIIDGRVVNERGRQWLETTDGRKIPFSALSSGQQELLPLMYGLSYAEMNADHRPILLYIEEPEAHLFPDAQTALVETLAQLINRNKAAPQKSKKHPAKVILTTHSPYVLAKINNLLKAGSLSSSLSLEKRKELEKILPSQSWIKPKNVNAYAILNRKLKPIIDELGLIDASYIDEVSAKTGIEFDSILELEASQ